MVIDQNKLSKGLNPALAPLLTFIAFGAVPFPTACPLP